MPTPRLTAPRRSGLVCSLAAGGVSVLAWMLVALATAGAMIWQPAEATTVLLINLASTITCCALVGSGLWWLALRMMRGQHRVAATIDDRSATIDTMAASLTDLHGVVQTLIAQVSMDRRTARLQQEVLLGAISELAASIREHGDRQWETGYEARDTDAGRSHEDLADAVTTVRPIRPLHRHN